MPGAQQRVTDFGAPAATGPFVERRGFVAHPYLKDGAIEWRDYQVRLAQEALRQRTLVVVPTGLGKTLVAALAAAEILRQRRGTVLFLAPTRPLAQQHFLTMRRLLKDEGLIQFFSGGIAPRQREEEWGKGILVVATPQTIRNDLASGRYTLAQVALAIFDEAHRAVGDYAYVEIGRRLREENPHARILGLTASPGATRDRVAQVRASLAIEAVEMRGPESQDVKSYVQPVAIETVWVELTPTLRRVANPFRALLAEKAKALREYGVLKTPPTRSVTKRELVHLQQSLARGGFFGAFHAAQLAYYALLCVEFGETQGVDALRRYLDRFQSKAKLKRNEKSFLKNAHVQDALELLRKPSESSHPKVDRLLGVLRPLVAKNPAALAMVFTQYRDGVESLVDALRAAGLKAERFVGQQARADHQGMDQDQQRATLDQFARRAFNVLVSTSVGEEGIDVPQVDLVVFYEAVPSEIRSIQRRGRTGRTVAGRVVVLVAKDTVDEAYYWSALAREKKMRKLVAGHAPR